MRLHCYQWAVPISGHAPPSPRLLGNDMDPISLFIYGSIWCAIYLGWVYLVFGGA